MDQILKESFKNIFKLQYIPYSIAIFIIFYSIARSIFTLIILGNIYLGNTQRQSFYFYETVIYNVLVVLSIILAFTYLVSKFYLLEKDNIKECLEEV